MMNKKSVLLVAVSCFLIAGAASAQQFGNVTSTAATHVQNEVTGVKDIVKYIMIMFAAGGFGYAMWAFFFRPEQAVAKVGGLIGGLVCAAVAVALQFIN